MKLPNISIKNYQFVLVLVFLGMLIGLNAFLTMPRAEDPSPDFPVYSIIAVYPGTGPQDMEELVVDPLEEAVEEVDDIRTVETKIEDGLAIITVEGYYGLDASAQFDDLRTEINAKRDQLPADLFSLDVQKFDPAKRVSIHQIALSSASASYAQLNDLAETLETNLKMLPGINDVEIGAIPDEEIRISLDFTRMVQHGISLQQVIQVLRQNNLNIPGGDVKSAGKSFNIKSSGSFVSIDEIRNTVIRADGGHVIYLNDLATIAYDYEDVTWKASYNGERSVLLNLTQKEGVNIVSLSSDIHSVLAEFRPALPESVELHTAFEQAPAVQARISSFFMNLMQGVLLVGAIILLFLGFRPSMIIMTVIPLSILMAIGALDFAGFALQQISIAALVIALGLLVDNGIVVIENIVRYQKMGYSFREAAAKGTSEVGLAIVSSTVTTLLAFFPLAMMESGPGEYLKSLPVTVILVLIFSLLLALTFTPIFASGFLTSTHRERWTERKMNEFIARVYRPALNFALRKPWAIMAIASGAFLGSVMLFPFIGVSFFPTADKPLLLIEIEAPRGSNIDETGTAVAFVEDILDTTGYVTSYTSNVGHGNPTIYYNRIGENYKKNHGQVLVNFSKWDPEKFYATLSSFRTAFREYPDAVISFRELKNGPPFEAPIEIKVIGNDLDTLSAIAAEVERIIRSESGVENVENPLSVHKTDLKVAINREKAAMMSLSIQDIDMSVRASLTGLKVDEMTNERGEEFDMVVRLPFEGDPGIEDFEKVDMLTSRGGRVPLKQVANIHYASAVNEILHYNTQRSTAVTAGVVNADAVTQITESIIGKLESVSLPQGYSFYIAGEYETQQESFGDLGKLLMIAMVGIFAVLVLQFRSVRQPLIVLSAIPLALTGSFVALFLTGWSFSFFAFVGFISLVGIVVNNSIILVDYTNQLMRQGMSMLHALKKATETRFTPIILTTTTTILGLLPLTASATGLWSPLGWTIIGGMISSTFLTLFIVPVLFRWLTVKS